VTLRVSDVRFYKKKIYTIFKYSPCIKTTKQVFINNKSAEKYAYICRNILDRPKNLPAAAVNKSQSSLFNAMVLGLYHYIMWNINTI